MSPQEKSISPVKPISIGIKKLLKIDKKYLSEKLTRGGYIMFDDGVLSYFTKHEIILLRYLLEPIVTIKLIDEVTLTSSLDLKLYYNNNTYTGKTINNIVEKMMELIITTYIIPSRGNNLIDPNYENKKRVIIDLEIDKIDYEKEKSKMPSKDLVVAFLKYCYVAMNSIYNEIVFENLEYITGLDIRDFLEIQFRPELMEAIASAGVLNNDESIKHSYAVLDTIMKLPELKDNPVAIGYNAGTMNPAQLRQMLACRGYVTEINGHIFKKPVTSSFVLGLSDIYEFSIESRSGAKALYFTVVGVEKSEYMARGIQLVATILDKVIEGDCGSTEYLDWYVRRADENDGVSDLDKMLGIKYLNEETGLLETITKHSEHIVGKTIKIRHINKCKLKNSKHVCQTCYGDIGYSLFGHNNAGFISTTVTTHKTTQFIISTKHLTQSAKAMNLILNAMVNKYLIVKNNSYYFRANLTFGNGTHKLVIEQNEINGIKELASLDPNTINPARISRLVSVYLNINTRNTKDMVEVKLKNNSAYGVLTKEAIAYIIKYGYSLDELDRVIIDLEHWDKSQPLIYAPEVEYSFLDLAIKVKSMFDIMENDETPESFLQKLFDVVNSKLNINLSLLSAMVYGFTVRDYEKNDFRLGRHSDKVSIRPLNTIINNRSLGGGYAWQNLGKNIFNPRVFYGNNAVSVPMDIIIDLNSGSKNNPTM